MTYADVDGDNVMLDDDEDLHDAAINQKLNPLRINVQLKSQSNAAPAAEPKPNATNTTPPNLLNDLNLIGSSLEEALRSPPQALKTFSTVTEDLAKNVSVPILTELLTAFSKLAVPQAAQPANVPSGNSSSAAIGAKETTPTASANATKTSPASKKSKGPKVVLNFDNEGATSGLPNANSCEEGPADNNDAEEKTAIELQRKGKAVMQNVSPKSFFFGQPGPLPPIRHEPHQNVFLKGPFFEQQPLCPPPMHSPHHHSFPFPKFGPFTGPPPPPPPPPPPQAHDSPVDNAFSSCMNGNVNAPSSDIPPYPRRFFPAGHPYRKADGYESMFTACHRRIACDGCDVSPIVGPRYKSTV